MNSGWINIYKPLGITSMDVIRRLRRLLGIKKIGHAGTLDPYAEGILPVAVGEATKSIAYMVDKTKVYRFILCFGCSTTTDDAEGEVIEKTDMLPSLEEINAVLAEFTGEIWQKPPLYSAVKIKGVRAYKAARQGLDIELDPRQVRVDRFESVATEGLEKGEFEFEVQCGPGTYIRSLARDVAKRLGSLGHAKHIKRLAVGSFCIDNSNHLDDLLDRGMSKEMLLPIQHSLDHLPEVQLGHLDQVKKLQSGQNLDLQKNSLNLDKNEDFAGQIMYATYDGKLIALVKCLEHDLKPERVFNLEN